MKPSKEKEAITLLDKVPFWYIGEGSCYLNGVSIIIHATYTIKERNLVRRLFKHYAYHKSKEKQQELLSKLGYNIYPDTESYFVRRWSKAPIYQELFLQLGRAVQETYKPYLSDNALSMGADEWYLLGNYFASRHQEEFDNKPIELPNISKEIGGKEIGNLKRQINHLLNCYKDKELSHVWSASVIMFSDYGNWVPYKDMSVRIIFEALYKELTGVKFIYAGETK